MIVLQIPFLSQKLFVRFHFQMATDRDGKIESVQKTFHRFFNIFKVAQKYSVKDFKNKHSIENILWNHISINRKIYHFHRIFLWTFFWFLKILHPFQLFSATDSPSNKLKIISGASNKVEMVSFSYVYFLLKYLKN